ncbi:MAG: MFS transporter [Candidatus Rokubacteria bacterium]|nr:MFS transporter [Candidatus Rokubacteria bacterium]
MAHADLQARHRLSPARVYYGWIIVAALSVTETVTWGIIYYGFPVFLGAMEKDLGASRVAVTGAFSVGMGVAALLAIPVGRWLDRHGPRGVMTAGSCLAVVLTFLWARVGSLFALYALWLLMGVAMAATLYEPAFAAVVGWFRTRNRDRALLTVTLVAGLASTIFMPLEAWLLGRHGWRSAVVTLAVVLAVITVPIHALVLRAPRPEPVARDGRPAAPPTGVSLAEARRTVVFWVLTIAFVVSNFATISVTVHLIPYLAARGWSVTAAAAAVGWIGAMQLPGRVFFAPVAAWVGHRWVTAAVFLVQGLALAQLALVAQMPSVIPLIVMLGASNGMSTLARASTIAEIFGSRHYGSIAGAVALGANGARAIGPVGASLLFVALGAYERVFWVLAGALAVVAVGVATIEARTAGGGGHA